ncbi:TRAP transporter large permease [Pararhodobacter zhoushanensis]|uniref:TRAP transporter large permease protein n=1 Tax=Pararhodobacter zhoushanensis TaxID=2479545 RepID=A0ABT3H5C9_9RHOB|nr:TRAP transporter large permease [Pararhodobacter zhoushanensis]MCW1934999.1 TRAP transporter large permease [Pararhodobacter zhoushanensis]
MSDVAIGGFGLAAILVLLALRVPIAFALISVSLAGIWALLGERPALGSLRTIPYQFVAHWSLSAIPMFLLMGSVAYHSGLVSSLYTAARLWLCRLPGGLAIASNFACAGFAAASGSSVATASAMGRIAVPEMLRYRYDPGLATGVVAAAGTLGSLIPPSILMILYGTFAEASIGQLMIAGILPGLLTAGIYAAMIWIRCVLNPDLAPPVDLNPTWRERFGSLAKVWPMPLLILGVIGGLYGGYVTATEAGALGAFLSIVIAALYRRLTWTVMRESIMDTITGTAVIFFVSIGAVLLSRFIALSGVPTFIVDLFGAGGLEGYAVVLFCGLVFLFLGMFLDPIGLMLIALPVMLPIIEQSGFDLIWFGILTIKFVEIGLITPPVGLSVYTIKTVVGDKVALTQIFRGIGWFLVCELLVVVLLVVFPQIALFLPGLMR